MPQFLTQLRLLSLLAGLILMSAEVQAQNDNDGQLGPRSSGRISLTLEITERASPTLTLVSAAGTETRLPAFLENELSRSLGESGTAQFPICLQDNGGGGSTVNLASGSEDMILTGQNGESIRYEVTISETTPEPAEIASSKDSGPAGCDGDAQFLVEVAVLDELPAAARAQLQGQFRLMITPE